MKQAVEIDVCRQVVAGIALVAHASMYTVLLSTFSGIRS